VRVSILIALFALACESSTPDREISKQLDISNRRRDGTTETQTCVEGDEATCTRAGGRWWADRCCLPKASCDFGEAAACARVAGTWTGTYCCLATEYRHRPGNDDEASCAKLGGAWTDRRCLVK
jgi:hypothetical protein